MKIKNRIKTNNFRTITKSFPRFISLMIMSFLAVFVFTGLQSTSPDMIKTLHNYYEKSNVYDIKIISTLGLTEEDISAINEIEEVEYAEKSYSKDLLINLGENESAINVSSIPKYLNKIELVDGELPKQANEIAVEENLIANNDLHIGDFINLDDEIFINKEVKIVGIIKSSLYINSVSINQSRGNTSIGTGTINYYTYMLEDNFDQDYYNAIYIEIHNNAEIASSDYNEAINNVISKIESIKEERENSRYDSLYNEANNKILEEEDKANKELSDAKEKLDDAKNILDNAKIKLDNAKKELDSTKKILNNAENTISQAEKKYNQTLQDNNINENDIDKNITQLKQNISNIEASLQYISKDTVEYITYYNNLIELKKNLEMLEKIKESKNEIAKNRSELQNNWNIYNNSYSEYTSNLSTYNSNYQTYLTNLEKYETSKKEAEDKINEAKEELNDIKHPVWYIYDRTDYQTYTDYIDDTESLKNLSKIFPIVFFAVSVLVSLTSMNRMVEDDREEIGTLKSLGFGNLRIMSKYFIFSFLATVIGGMLGAILGSIIIPLIIFNIYGILFDIPNFEIHFYIKNILTSILISVFCICGSSIYSTNKILKEKASDLMRPKAPKNGKKVILEKIPFIWKKLNFSQKVTIRNLFRYKKRAVVTIVGIAGCTALMLCGFGIKDGISEIATKQYGEVFTFDGMAYVNNLDDISIFENENIEQITAVEMLNSKCNDIEVTMFVTNNEDLKDIANLEDLNGNKVELETGKIIITNKFAELINAKIGDEVEIEDSDHKLYIYEISNIVKNYLGHYIYLDQETFAKYNQDFKVNVVYIDTNDITSEEQDDISKKLLENDEILTISFNEDLMESVSNMLESLNKVVLILIILAALLAFVVLYNLSNINIHERKREIATLKVLGFYPKEVDNYITKETVIFTAIGIALGLIFGYFLTNIVIETVEIEKARFIHYISILSFGCAAFLSIIFTLIVNTITHFTLKKIDMIESLKSVE